MNSISSWICTNNNRNLFVKIIYPGGRVEIHDEPIAAAELLRRNPKCCVAHPTVFRHPYAVVSPSATLALGHKYYVVPIGTIVKLQLQLQLRQSASRSREVISDVRLDDRKKKDRGRVEYPSPWWLRMRNGRDNGCEVKCGEKRKTAVGGAGKGGSISFSHWQPALERITEE